MTSAARRKGNKAEREAAAQLVALTGWPVRRRLQEGRADDTGDLEGVPDCCVQVKDYVDPARALREALAELPAQHQRSGCTYAAALIRHPGGRFTAAMTLDMFAALIRDATT